MLVPGGKVFVNDLRRDADEFMINYKIQEIKNCNSLNVEWFSNKYIATLCSSYLIDEVKDILGQAQLDQYQFLDDGPMTFTLVSEKPK